MKKRFIGFVECFPVSKYYVCLLMLVMSGVVSTAVARVGEDRATVENRLLGSKTGQKYPKEAIEKKVKGTPYHAKLEVLRKAEFDYDVGIYWKTTDAEKLSKKSDVSPENLRKNFVKSVGWDLHVVYVNNRSVLEYYKRNGRGMTKQEFEGILALNMGGSTWRPVNKGDNEESLFGYNFELASGSLRALQAGSGLVIISSTFDKKLKKSLENAQKLEAPSSILGF